MNLPDAPVAREGFFVTHFFTVRNQEKSKDFYVRILKTASLGSAFIRICLYGIGCSTFFFLLDEATNELRNMTLATRRRRVPCPHLQLLCFCCQFATSLHRQHDAELRFAAHHARIGLGRFFERICFNHGAHAG